MVDNTQSRTHVIDHSAENVKRAAQALRDGKLVSFPTETVFGLGANAKDPDACLQIFKSKGRPLTDPLIVHVDCVERALELISDNEKVLTTFKELAAHYWPGPLTLVTKANLDLIPMLITANTGYIGIRVPNHPVAQELLLESGVPVAAPSANKFGHVSPTRAEHVYNDFHKDSEVLILDGGACNFGIESTVLKITDAELLIIRKGGVSQSNLEQHLGILTHQFTIKQLGKQSKEETVNCEAPGQFLRHYSPDIVSYLFDGQYKSTKDMELSDAVLIDFGSEFAALKD